MEPGQTQRWYHSRRWQKRSLFQNTLDTFQVSCIKGQVSDWRKWPHAGVPCGPVQHLLLPCLVTPAHSSCCCLVMEKPRSQSPGGSRSRRDSHVLAGGSLSTSTSSLDAGCVPPPHACLCDELYSLTGEGSEALSLCFLKHRPQSPTEWREGSVTDVGAERKPQQETVPWLSDSQ